MHFLLCYQVDSSAEKCSIIHTDIRSIVSKYKNVNLFGETYIIHISKITEWEDIRLALNEVTSKNGCDCKFIMTPIIEGGYYNGWLQRDKWGEIRNLITSAN